MSQSYAACAHLACGRKGTRKPTALCVAYIESVEQTLLLAAHRGGVVRTLAAVVQPLQQTLALEFLNPTPIVELTKPTACCPPCA